MDPQLKITTRHQVLIREQNNTSQIDTQPNASSKVPIETLLIDLIYEYALRHITTTSTQDFLSFTSVNDYFRTRYHSRPDTFSFLSNKTLVQINNKLVKSDIFNKDDDDIEENEERDMALFRILSGYAFIKHFNYEKGISKLESFFPELFNPDHTAIECIQNLYRAFEVIEGKVCYQGEEIYELWKTFLSSISDEDKLDLVKKLTQVETIDNNNAYLFTFLANFTQDFPLSLKSIKLSNIYHRIFPSEAEKSSLNYLTIPHHLMSRLTNLKDLRLEDKSLDKNSTVNIEDLSRNMEKLSLSHNPSFTTVSYELSHDWGAIENQLNWDTIDFSYTSMAGVKTKRNEDEVENQSLLNFSTYYLNKAKSINLRNTYVSGSTLYMEASSLEKLSLALSKIDIGENFLLDIQHLLKQFRRYNLDEALREEYQNGFYPLLSREEYRSFVNRILLSDEVLDLADEEVYLFGLIDTCHSIQEVKKLLRSIHITETQYGSSLFTILYKIVGPTFSSGTSSLCSIL